MIYNKRHVYLFLQKPDSIEKKDIILFMPFNLEKYNLLSLPLLDFLRKEIKSGQSSKHIFRKPKNNIEYSQFLQTLRDLLPVNIYFAIRENGNIWCVEHSDEEKIEQDHMKALGLISSL
jgi:hypothetical protein